MKRVFPNNPDCPLTEQEQKELEANLADLEAEFYHPFKHQSGGFADATVYEINEFEVKVEVKYGIDGEVEYTEDITIERPDIL